MNTREEWEDVRILAEKWGFETMKRLAERRIEEIQLQKRRSSG